MSRILNDLLAMDRLASQFGCALNPKLRATMEADARFPARAAVPRPSAEVVSQTLPKNVTRLSDHMATKAKQSA